MRKPIKPITVSRAVLSALAAQDKARAQVDKFCARPKSAERPDDDKTLAALCDTDMRTLWHLLDVEPVAHGDVAMILDHVARYSAAGHVLPEREGGAFEGDLIRTAAGWLAKLDGWPAKAA